MRIEFQPPIEDHGNSTSEGLVYFFEIVCGKQHLESIDRYIITEDSNYELIVSSIDEKEKVSNNDSVIGVAKTIYNEEVNKSTIILRNNQIIPIIEGLNSSKPIEDWTETQLNALYTSLHEFGHANDNLNRLHIPTGYLKRPFFFSRVTKYYARIIASEIGANICTQSTLPIAFKENGRNGLIKHVKDSCQELINLIDSSTPLLDEISCYNLIGHISITILKLQEVFIHRPNENEELIRSFDTEILIEIREWLLNMEATYPIWKEVESNFEKIVLKILENYQLELIKGIQFDIIKKCA